MTKTLFFFVIFCTHACLAFDESAAIKDVKLHYSKHPGTDMYDYLKTLNVLTVEKTQDFVEEADKRSVYGQFFRNKVPLTPENKKVVKANHPTTKAESQWPQPSQTIVAADRINFFLLKAANFNRGVATPAQLRDTLTAVFAVQRSIAANGTKPEKQLLYPATPYADERMNGYVVHLNILRSIFDEYIDKLGLALKTPTGNTTATKIENISKWAHQIAQNSVNTLKNDASIPEWAHNKLNKISDPANKYEAYIKKELLPILESYLRIRAIILGSAIGDSIGVPNEFSGGPNGSVHGFKRLMYSFDDANKGMSSPVPGQRWDNLLVEGQFTDDTSMGLAAAQKLIEDGKFTPLTTLEAYHDWWFKGYYSAICSGIGLGATIKNHIYAFKDHLTKAGVDFDPYAKDTKTSTNGSLMRMAHTAVFEWDDLDALVSLAEQQGRITHQAPQSVQCTRLMAWLLFQVIHGNFTSKDDLFEKFSAHALSDEDLDPELKAFINEKTWTKKLNTLGEKTNFLNRPINTTLNGGKGFNRLEGSAVGSFEVALWAFYQTDSFADGILELANIGFDSDTNACILGILAGAYYGLEGIPAEWIQKLQWHDGMQEFTLRLFFRGNTRKPCA